MTSWRDTTSEQVRSDLDRLLTTVLPFAEEMLARHGEFYPYGAAITSTGDEQLFAADVGDDQEPNPSAILTSLVSGMSAEAAELRAAAVVSDVTSARSDAIMVHLEHSDSMAITVLVPYRSVGGTNDVDYDEMTAQPAEAMIWRRSLC